MAIARGERVEVRTASGEMAVMRALGGPTRGRDFEVVWVCSEEDWPAAGDAEDRSVDHELGIPWPVEHVLVLHHV